MRKASRSGLGSSNSFSTYLDHLDEENSSILARLRSLDYHTFRHAVLHVKYNTAWGLWWDVLLVVMSLVACGTYVMETYWSTFRALLIYTFIENVITQFFLLDFILGWVASHSTRRYFSKLWTWVDLATIAPVYMNYMLSESDEGPNLSILRFLRILRLIRILKTFRLLGDMSGVKRQTVTMSLALASLIFMAAGIIHIFENDLQQATYDCQYINVLTDFKPSCDPIHPTFGSLDCDCQEYKCRPHYTQNDHNHEPSSIKCHTMQFFDSLFFVFITIYPVGYGSLVVTDVSRATIVLLIVASLVFIPIQINKLALLIKMNSRYRKPFETIPYENHVLLCGFCNDKEKLSRVLREFFNPDRISSKTPLFHMVIMAPQEPHEDVIDLMNSPLFESRLSYIIGSALDEGDLLKARADVASAIFFISDSQADYDQSTCEDAATVLRTLSIINYNPDLECFVEVLNEHDKRTLEDCHADVVLCLDDYKYSLQARSSICMGLSTLCENLFNSFTDAFEVASAGRKEHWLSEYRHGLGMEIYNFNIDRGFFSMLNFNWGLLVECIYVEFGLVLMGVCRTSDHTVHMNPRNYEHRFSSIREYYKEYSVGVVLAPDYNDVLVMKYALSDAKCRGFMLSKMQDAEFHFTTRHASCFDPNKGSSQEKRALANMRQMSSMNPSHQHSDAQADQLQQAKVLSGLMRTQLYFDKKYSLKQCYQKAQVRKAGPLRASMSITSRGDHDSESDSSRGDQEEFVGFLDEDDASLSGSDDSNPFKDKDDDKEGGNHNKSCSDATTTSHTSHTTNTHAHAHPHPHPPRAARGSVTYPQKHGAAMAKRHAFVAAPSKSGKHKSVESAFEPDGCSDSFAEEEERPRGNNLKELVKVHSRGCQLAAPAPASAPSSSPAATKKVNFDQTSQSEQSEAAPLAEGLKDEQRVVKKFSLAARNVTTMLKDDDWGDALTALHQHPHQPKVVSEFPLLDNMTTITPLQREIMQAKRKKRVGDTRVTSSKGSPMKVYTQRMDTSMLRIDPASPKLEDPSSGQNSPHRKVGTPNNFADTLRKFQVMKQKTFKRSSSRVLSKGRSSERLVLESATSDQSPPAPPLTIDVCKPASTQDRLRRFQSRESRSSLGEFGVDVTDRTHVASKLRGFHRARSSVGDIRTSSGSDDKSKQKQQQQSPHVGLDVGEIMGAHSAAKRTLSKSKSKSITDSPVERKLLRANSFDNKTGTDTDAGHLEERLPSAEISNAKQLNNHVIIIGCLDFLVKFVKMLRKSNLSTHDNYHSILLVSEDEPADWPHIKHTYKDVFYMRRTTVTDQDFLYMNLRSALSVTILGSRTRETLDEATNIDSNVLFKYLAIETKIPSHVNITVEIFRPSSVGVINSARNHHKLGVSSTIGEKSTGISRKVNSTKGTGMKIAGNDRASFYMFVSSFLDVNDCDSDEESEVAGKDVIKPMSYRKDKIAPMTIERQQGTNRSVSRDVPEGRSRQHRMSVAGMAKSLRGNDKSGGSAEPEQTRGSRAMNFWGSRDTHHLLPVFAAGRAFVPTAFDAIFVQSFFSSYSLQTCEKLISGDEAQLVMKVKVPSTFVDRTFVDMFRALNSRGLIVMGLYRIPHAHNDAQLPYVFTNPPCDTVLRAGDQMFVYGHPELLQEARKAISSPLNYLQDGRVCMATDDIIIIN